MKIQPVVLCGGGGSRLWPRSRTHYPKQFLTFFGPHSLLQETVLRFQGDDYEPPILLTQEDHRFLVAEQMKQIGVKATILLEPCIRNTAASIALASYFVEEQTPLLFLPSDHEIENPQPLYEALALGKKYMGQDHLIVFGVPPTRPETGYGYIIPSQIDSHKGIYLVERFEEKPSQDRALALLKDPCYWNSGMFLGSACQWRKQIACFLPDTALNVQKALQEMQHDLDFIRIPQVPFEHCPSVSIDKGVIEKVKQLWVLPLKSVGWSDLGSWDSVAQISDTDEQANSFLGDVVAEGVCNSYIRADGVLVSVVGLSDLIVVATKDAVLITKKGQSQKVKEVTAHLKSRQRSEADFHQRVYRPWGYYEEIDAGTRFKVKRLMLTPQSKTSLQIHHHRAEHWVVVSGTACVEVDGSKRLVHENEAVYIPSGASHSIENPGKIDLHLIEVQSGAYLGEDDIVRLSDMYGRCS